MYKIKMLFWIIIPTLLLMSSCKNVNGKIFLDNVACYGEDDLIKGGPWKIQNTSYNHRIQFTYKETLSQENGEKVTDTRTITLDPGEIGYLGCANINGKFYWETEDKWQTAKYEIVGELVQRVEN